MTILLFDGSAIVHAGLSRGTDIKGEVDLIQTDTVRTPGEGVSDFKNDPAYNVLLRNAVKLVFSNSENIDPLVRALLHVKEAMEQAKKGKTE